MKIKAEALKIIENIFSKNAISPNFVSIRPPRSGSEEELNKTLIFL